MIRIRMIFGVCLWLSGPGWVWAQPNTLPSSLQPTIFVNADVSTWKVRGRLLYDLEGTVLKKVSLAGFQPVREMTVPHEYELSVVYREERGQQYTVDSWGTVIRGDFRFSGLTLTEAAGWSLEAFSDNSVSGPPPYLDALVKFETEPLYFFLGDVLMYLATNAGDIHEGLKMILERRVRTAYALSDPTLAHERAISPDHFMDPSSVIFQDMAFQRTIEELRRHGYSEQDLVPITRKTLRAPGRELRLQAVTLLAKAEDMESCLPFNQLIQNETDPEIKGRAVEFLEKCSTSP